MKSKQATAILAGIISFAVLTQTSHAGNIEKKYTYRGDDGARSICMAIAKNQPNRLKRALRDEKYGLADTKVHTRFHCNGKDLLSFSEEMGAYKVAQILAPKFNKEHGIAVANAEGQ